VLSSHDICRLKATFFSAAPNVTISSQPAQFSVIEYTLLFGLNIRLAEYQSNLNAAIAFYQVRKDIEVS